jgi:hypothetical protein
LKGTEKNPVLQAMVAVLMGGSVTIGDNIFQSNQTLLRSLFTSNGEKLLKPDTPAVYMDAT